MTNELSNATDAELIAHRDNAHPDWYTTRGALNYADVIAGRACPDYRTDRDYPPEEATT